MRDVFTPAYLRPSAYTSMGMTDIFTPASMRRTPNFDRNYLYPRGGLGDDAMRDTFTPAYYSPNAPVMPGGADDRRHPKFINWLDQRIKDTPGYYPHALLSYYFWGNKTHQHFPADGFILGDSGGYSVMTEGATIDPREALLWQMRECSVGPVLDVPPISPQFKRIFQKGLDGTIANTKAALPLYLKHREEGGKFRWWGVVQGWTADNLEHWYKEMVKVYPFDDDEGWALKPRPRTDETTTARVMRFVRQKEFKRIHLFMATGIKAVAAIHYFGPKAGLEFVSYDSTSAALQATQRAAMAPVESGLKWNSVNERGTGREARTYLVEKCDCFSCRALREDVKEDPSLMTGGWRPHWVFRFSYHNLLTMVNTFKRLRQATEADPDGTFEAVVGREDASAARRAWEGREAFQDAPEEHGSLLDHI